MAPGALDTLLDVDAAGWLKELDGIAEYLATFGKHTPQRLLDEKQRVRQALQQAHA